MNMQRFFFRHSYFLPGLLLLFVYAFPNPLRALDPDKPVSQYLEDKWSVEEGLSSTYISAVAQTPDGYLWIATSKNLHRFDGITFHTLHLIENRKTREGEDVSADTLYVDKGGVLWAGSALGLDRYESGTGDFVTFDAKDGLTADRIRHIKGDINGNLWISFAASYVNRYTDGKFTVFNASHGLEGKKINAIVEDLKGQLLFGTRENGIFKFQDGSFSRYEVPGLDDSHAVISMYEDHKGRLWITTNKGLFMLKGKNAVAYTTRDGLSDNFTTFVIEDIDNNMWVGTINGLNRLKEERPGSFSFENLMMGHTVTWLMEDMEKSVWVGTDNAGIWRLKDGLFRSYAASGDFSKRLTRSLFEDREGNTWFGTLDGKLFRCPGNDCPGPVEVAELPGIAIMAIAQDENGYLWLGTNGKGVFRLKDGRLINFTTADGLSDNLVNSIFKDSKNNLWFGTLDGVSRYSGGTIDAFRSGDGLVGKEVNNVYETGDSRILVATNKGLDVLENGRLQKDSITTYLRGVNVTCIYLEKSPPGSPGDGEIVWIATSGSGLKRLKNGTIFSYTRQDGLDTDFIYQLMEDSRANLWMTSDSGVLRLNKNELNRYADGSIPRVNCSSFGIPDGMSSVEFNNPFSRHTALKTRDGEFWFITAKGISVIHPDKININKFPPPVVIEKIHFNEDPVFKPRGQITRKGIEYISIYFTAPSLLAPEKIKFKYKMDGIDDDWVYIQPGKERAARYRNLEPCIYTFRVTACNNDGIWNKKGVSVTLILEPYFYQTLFFKIAVLIVFLLLVLSAYVLYKKRPFNQKEDKKEKSRSSSLHPEFINECLKKLEFMMDIDKLYRDETLSLQSLAEKLSLSSHQLSQILNDNLNKNFWDFVNTYRVEEAKRLLRDPERKNRKILSIAFDVGFNTKASFNQVFKRYSGMTPSEYKKKGNDV